MGIAFLVGFLSYFAAGIIALSLIAAFIIDIFRWNLSPWFLWPLGVLSVAALSLTGFNLLMAFDCKKGTAKRDFVMAGYELPPISSYRWGRFQGALTCGSGLLLFIPALLTLNPLAIPLSVLSIVGGFGILRKKMFGYVIFYITFAAFILIGSIAIIFGAVPSSPLYYLAGTISLFYLFIPAGFYYPKRVQDFS